MAVGVIRAILKNENDFDELFEMFHDDNPPVEAERETLLVEINIISHDEREVILDFLNKKKATILKDEIKYEED